MSVHRLLLSANDGALTRLSPDDLLWRREDASSVDTNLGPRLEGLGPVPALHVDFVRLAGLVFFCDRTVPRTGMGRRELDLEVAVSDPDRWAPHAAQLADLLGVLTGDSWTLAFTRRREARLVEAAPAPEGDLTVLFSGGADSACGAVAAHTDGHPPILASHFDWSSVRGQQRRTLTALEPVLGADLPNPTWRFARQSTQVGSGASFGEERSRRSRSILFIALGLAVAATVESELWVAENGFTSLNPPLSGERRGALSTRTTHPAILLGLQEVLRAVGLRAELRNPFAALTKGQVFREVAAQTGDEDASGLLSATHSCAKPGREKGFAPDEHCGVCMGCLVRRGAFLAAGIRDDTVYIEQGLGSDPQRRARWLSPKRRETYESVRYRAEIGFTEDDVIALGLPDESDLDDALRLANEGLTELAAVTVP